MAANSPLIQPRLQLLVSQGAWILKPFPLITTEGREHKNPLLREYGEVLCRLYKSIYFIMGTLKRCVQSAFCRVWDGASAACLHITSEDSEPLCTWLKPDPGLTGSTVRHVEILEFMGGWSQNKYPFQQQGSEGFPSSYRIVSLNYCSPVILYWRVFAFVTTNPSKWIWRTFVYMDKLISLCAISSA